MKKFALYTARFGKPSRFNFPKISVSDIDKFCFTDLNINGDMIPISHGQFVKNGFYEIKKMKLNHRTSIRNQRFVKICIPDEIFDNYEYSLYSDCKRPFMFDFDFLLSRMEPQSDFLIRRHQKRTCLYDEAMVCIKKKKDSEEIITKQTDFYRSKNYPRHNGLYVSFWLFRRHTEKMKMFSMLWWMQLEKYSHRDQISLPYVVWKHGMKISVCERQK